MRRLAVVTGWQCEGMTRAVLTKLMGPPGTWVRADLGFEACVHVPTVNFGTILLFL